MSYYEEVMKLPEASYEVSDPKRLKIHNNYDMKPAMAWTIAQLPEPKKLFAEHIPSAPDSRMTNHAAMYAREEAALGVVRR